MDDPTFMYVYVYIYSVKMKTLHDIIPIYTCLPL